MTYVKLPDRIFRDPRMVTVSSGAKLIYIAGLCWCAENKTGSIIPFRALKCLSKQTGVKSLIEIAQELCHARLWDHIEGEITQYRVVDDVRIWSAPSNRPTKSVWRELRDTVFRRDDYTCQYCGARGGRLECDHVVPVSRGGPHSLSNLVTACLPCNRRKSGKTVEEWQA